MKQLFILLFSLLSFAYAQKGSISGKVLDTAGHKKVPLATITVFNAADTSIVTYRLSDENGAFKVPGLPLDKTLRFIVTYSGYDAYRQEFTLTAARPDVPFDSIMMQPSSKQLDDVVVLAERPPVMIKNDTIEFNANSFKTLPNALVEDLLKKLPGVQVDKDGNITVNGKPVSRIMVDGKNFFGGDPKMATRNLPANIIDKIQVTDDKEELERSGDNNINNVGKVVNIKLKKGVKKGVFGKVYAGGGTDKRYEAGGIANLFRDTLQISLLGYSNSLNKPGFSYNEIMQSGGFERSNASLNSRNTSISTNSSGGSNISVNGINFGGSQGGGIATSTGGGININHSPNAKQSIFGQYFYGNVKVDRRTVTNLGQYNQDTVVTNNTNLLGDIITNAHSFGVGTKLKTDSVTTLLANANYTIGLQDESINRQVSAINNIKGPLSQGSITQGNEINTYLYKHNISYTRLSKKEKGRRLSANHGLSVSNGVNNYATDATIRYINPTPYDSLLQQMRYERIPSTEAFASINYRDPLSKSFTITAAARYEYAKLSNRVNTYSRIGSSGEYDKYNPALSSEFNREMHRSKTSIGLEYKWKDIAITPSIGSIWQKVDNELASLPQPIRQNQFNILPAFSVVYKQFNIYYDRGIVLPAYTYLIPVLNNTNPYYVVKGNPALLPATTDNLSTNWYQNFPKRNVNINLWASVSSTKNAVIQSVIVDDKGVQTTTPVNADGSRSLMFNYNLEKQYKSGNNRNLRLNIGAWVGYNRSRLLYNGESSWQATTSMSNWAGVNLNLNDKLEWNNSYWISHNFSRFTSPQFKNLTTIQQTLASEIIVRVPKHVIWETNVNYEFNGNVPAGLPRNSFRINAAVNFTMLKDEKGVLRLSVWDILNRNNNVGYYTNRNTITASQSNALNRYFMATFTYNIRSLGGAKKKVGGGGIFGY